jgi:maltooligosyltrehalose synthase
VIAFARSFDGTDVLVAASRWFSRLGGANALPVGTDVWQDTRIDVPSGGTWRNVLTGERSAVDEQLLLADAFATMPWGAWVRESP